MAEDSIKQDVRRFYDDTGWQQVSEGVYQNAEYEDLRPVSREYIHKCHLRVKRFLNPNGRYLLDAGSGPIQYPEYLTYSQGYQYHVCLDISLVALQEACKRIGTHGLFVVGDITRLPFREDSFDAIVSLHTIHHLSQSDQPSAYRELRRVLGSNCGGVIVNGWEESPLMRFFQYPVGLMEKCFRSKAIHSQSPEDGKEHNPIKPQGTFVYKLNAKNLRVLLGEDFPVEIRVWRSVSVRFLRAMIHPILFGGLWLRILYRLEEIFPKFFGKKGQYPLIIIRK